LIERFFNKIKQCRRVATRYDKLAANYLAFIQLASIRLWLRINEFTPLVQTSQREAIHARLAILGLACLRSHVRRGIDYGRGYGGWRSRGAPETSWLRVFGVVGVRAANLGGSWNCYPDWSQLRLGRQLHTQSPARLDEPVCCFPPPRRARAVGARRQPGV